MKSSRLHNFVLPLTLLLVLSVGWAQAQDIGTDEQSQPQYGNTVTATLEDAIPIQGRLTDTSGVPLTGDHSVTFSLYDDPIAGSLLCSTNYNPLPMTNGLFNVIVTGCTSTDIDGEQLYLGVQVDADAEMTPRQPIYAVPYARSLYPGADIRGELDASSVLALYNSSAADGSKGLWAEALGDSGITYGVFGRSNSPDGYGGFFNNDNGVALRVAGSGIIQSTASSYLWISGNGLQKSVSDDTTRFEYDEYGGYKVSGGADWGTVKRVILPVTIPGQLYGQNVTVTGMDLYYTVPFDLTGIDAIVLRRQNGVGAGNLILYDDTDLVCAVAQCVHHWDLTQNNVLSDEQGILHLVLRLAFSGEAAYVQIGGVRLTLEHK